MTVSQLRRRVNALKRRFAPELTIIKLRRIAEAVADDWTPDQPPEPSDVIGRIAKAGFRLPTFARLNRYLNDTRRQGDVPACCLIEKCYRNSSTWGPPQPALIPALQGVPPWARQPWRRPALCS